MPRKLLTISPSSVFSEYSDGSVVQIGDKKYLVLSRDPWQVYATRYYWFDVYLGRLHEWRKANEDKDGSQ